MILIVVLEILDLMGLDHARRYIQLPQMQPLRVVRFGRNVPREITGMED